MNWKRIIFLLEFLEKSFWMKDYQSVHSFETGWSLITFQKCPVYLFKMTGLLTFQNQVWCGFLFLDFTIFAFQPVSQDTISAKMEFTKFSVGFRKQLAQTIESFKPLNFVEFNFSTGQFHKFLTLYKRGAGLFYAFS